MLLYFGILFQNNCGSLRRLQHSALLLILLFLPSPRISFTLNSKTFFLNNPFLLSLVCTNSCQFSGPLTLLPVFILQSFSPCRSFSHRSSTPVSNTLCCLPVSSASAERAMINEVENTLKSIENQLYSWQMKQYVSTDHDSCCIKGHTPNK